MQSWPELTLLGQHTQAAQAAAPVIDCKRIIVPSACRVGKGHNAASSLVKIPSKEKKAQPPSHDTSQTRPRCAAGQVDVFFTTPPRWAQMAGGRAQTGSNKRRPPSPLCKPTHRPITHIHTLGPDLLASSCFRCCLFVACDCFLIKRAFPWARFVLFFSCRLFAFRSSPVPRRSLDPKKRASSRTASRRDL